MTLRIRTDARLTRPIPEIPSWEKRTPAVRISAREELLKPADRTVPGEKLVSPPVASREPALKQRVSPAPNAPLLIRIVRHPFSLEPAKRAKQPTESTSHRGLRDRPQHEGPGRAFRALLQELNAMARAFGQHSEAAEARPAPRTRLISRGREEA